MGPYFSGIVAMTKFIPPTLEQHLCFSLYSTSLKMTQLYKPLLAPLNLTYPQYLVMVVLWQEQGLGVKDVAQRLQQDSGSITPLIKRLEAQGLISRSRDSRDERNVLLELTAAGEAMRRAGVKVSEAIADGCAIRPAEFERMMADLSKLNKKLT
ncbi:DNA-binding MarR family transcriptional regulator [Herbaspirillum sp. Sphag1AN]|uniref:MarR family winged helix-turn-helix transcriptional regulator n=1 Tax=unclassified Herbaspirillum TaxID=2624150 RepID=UPI001852E256|nr:MULTISPECIES: MarR family transcriptional regulator [unclassified Herbaspirillum]MBB3213264.1 DNA-binding MarR family transcriptional regulator [Herbaspirillum sp. Sphag1AN]MBB3246461.1 DNA-binding MarR family transcriptional regulator [Herbaspirillum sp. Sphag64]